VEFYNLQSRAYLTENLITEFEEVLNKAALKKSTLFLFEKYLSNTLRSGGDSIRGHCNYIRYQLARNLKGDYSFVISEELQKVDSILAFLVKEAGKEGFCWNSILMAVRVLKDEKKNEEG